MFIFYFCRILVGQYVIAVKVGSVCVLPALDPRTSGLSLRCSPSPVPLKEVNKVPPPSGWKPIGRSPSPDLDEKVPSTGTKNKSSMSPVKFGKMLSPPMAYKKGPQERSVQIILTFLGGFFFFIYSLYLCPSLSLSK